VYLDPGGVMYVVQILIAGVLAALFWFKNVRDKIVNIFRRSGKKKEDHE
jgi:hypothetical protein